MEPELTEEQFLSVFFTAIYATFLSHIPADEESIGECLAASADSAGKDRGRFPANVAAQKFLEFCKDSENAEILPLGILFFSTELDVHQGYRSLLESDLHLDSKEILLLIRMGKAFNERAISLKGRRNNK